MTRIEDFVREDGKVRYIGKDTIVTIPEELEDTDAVDAFENCPFIKKIIIPKNKEILSLSGLENLEEIEVDPDNPYCSSIDNILYNKDQTEVYCCPKGRKGKVVLPNTVDTISCYAFTGCNKLESIYLPSSVKYLIDTPFYDCDAEIIIDPENDTLVSIDGIIYTKGMDSIVHCSTKKKGALVLPESVISCCFATFVGCSLLTSIEFTGDYLLGFGDYSFTGCDSLETIIIPSDIVNFNDNEVVERIFVVKVKNDFLQNPEVVRDLIIPRTKTVYFEGPFEMAISTDLYHFIVDADERSIEMFYKNEESEYVKFSIVEDENGPVFGNYYDYFSIDEDGELYEYNGPISGFDLKIPPNVLSVYAETFDGSEAFNSVFIPKLLTNFDCMPLVNTKAFIVDKDNPEYTAIDGDLYSKDKATLFSCAARKEETINISSFVKRIEFGAFWYCELTTIMIPNSIIYFDFGALINDDLNIIMHVNPNLKVIEADEPLVLGSFKEIYFEMDEEEARQSKFYALYKESDEYRDENKSAKLFYLKDEKYIPFQ